eukprot:1155717-Pelagomonas_calceolata.AAC.1
MKYKFHSFEVILVFVLPTCRHEVLAMAITDPVSGQAALLLLQTDITSRAVLESRMAALTESQLAMLEQMFPSFQDTPLLLVCGIYARARVRDESWKASTAAWEGCRAVSCPAMHLHTCIPSACVGVHGDQAARPATCAGRDSQPSGQLPRERHDPVHRVRGFFKSNFIEQAVMVLECGMLPLDVDLCPCSETNQDLVGRCWCRHCLLKLKMFKTAGRVPHHSWEMLRAMSADFPDREAIFFWRRKKC